MTGESIPSQLRELLLSIRNASIARLTRYSWLAKEAAARGGDLPANLVFSGTSGPLIIALQSGPVIGVASQPSLISVTLWLEREAGSDPDVHAVEADDPHFSRPEFAQMIGRRVTDISILVRDAQNALWESCPREVGVLLAIEDAPDLLLSHGLHDDSDDFSVLLREDVRSTLWPQLREMRVE
ncbi:MAG: hypothetical protein E6J90_05715 [Deltaproteobacteria bacterium]|nr:MAG: hypothetical protein E6J91_13075 [Deltaproteobacteria bacterium]TMQ25573.1 MAG: hypothetical protein E6J90_05715 [Deltaproteobacteria bacterium]